MRSNPTSGMDVCVRLFFVCAVLCAGSGLVTGQSAVQGALLIAKQDQETEKAAKAQQTAVEP
jgi:hypothetical protein